MRKESPVLGKEFILNFASKLFRSWFINFDIVRKKESPETESTANRSIIDIFPERMVESELGPIPEGWHVGKLGDYVSIVGGGTPSTSDEELWNGEIPWISPKDLSTNDTSVIVSTSKSISEEGLKTISSGLLPVDTVLMSCRAPIGYCAMTKIELAINQGFIAFLPTGYLSKAFILNWCLSNQILIESFAGGSTFPEISKSNLKQIRCVIPPKMVIDEFERIVQPIYQKIAIDELISKIIRKQS